MSMKKFYLFLSALFAFTLSGSAATKYLYQQTFESVNSVEETGFVSTSLGSAAFTIGNNDDGHYLLYKTGANNDRSCYLFWGQDVIKSANASTYSVSFGFNAEAWGNNHQSAELTVMSTAAESTLKNYNGNYRAKSQDWLFDLTQLDSKNGGSTAAGASGTQVFAVNGDTLNTVSLGSGAYYTVQLNIDTVARTVDYSITSRSGSEVATGVYTLPEGTDVSASGIYFLGARYQSAMQFDDILVYTEVEQDFANVPTVTLSSVNNKQRVYSITFLKGETLHYTFNGDEEEVSYGDCDGVYTFSNNPDYDPENEELVTDDCPGGELVVWTTYGDATSDKLSVDVDNSIIQLPAVQTSITNVEEGFSKTYKLTADNSNVPMKPVLFISYTFTPEGGGTVLHGEELSSGQNVTLPSKGTLEVTTSAFGYGSTTTSIVNDIEYNKTLEYNIASLTDDQLAAAGFSADANATDNWANYGRIYGYDKNNFTTAENAETGKVDTAYTKLVYSDIPVFTKLSSAWTDSVIYDRLAFKTIPGVNVHFYKNLGLITEGRKGDDKSGNWISNSYVFVNGLTDNDFVVYTSMGNYGSTSVHPYVSSLDEFLTADKGGVTTVLSGTETFPILRISDCLTGVKVLRPVGTIDGINTVSTTVDNVNAPVYNLAGARVNANNLPAGVYIKNGKKFIVNK